MADYLDSSSTPVATTSAWQGFTSWLTSGWDEAAAQWAHPLTSIGDEFDSFAGLSYTPIPGSTAFPEPTADNPDPTAPGSISTPTGNADPGSASSFTSTIVLIIVILFLVLLIMGKVEAL